MSSKKQKKNLGQIIFIIFMLLAGMVCGVVVGEFISSAEEHGKATWEYLLLLVVAIYVAMFIQIVVHETGHLAFGLATGYQFSSFRIGSLMVLKENGKIKLRKFSIAGTGGQCLMSPPDLVDGQMPVVLYNLGGCIFNLIVSAMFAVTAFFKQDSPEEFIFYVCIVVIGLAFALSNGIPMQVGMISNDGMNALSLGKNPVALKAFWTQLKVNEQIGKGKRLKEMPAQWFEVPTDEEMKNGLVAAIAVFHANWLMDQLKLEEAAAYIKQLLSKKTGILGLHRSLLINDRIYCELVVERNISEAIYLHDKAYEKFLEQMKNTPSIIRSEYAYALIAEKDEEKAQNLLKSFEKVAKTYPYPSEIEGERELIERCKL
ncbi:MAG: hypothetical protein IJ455_04235 [Agathobacter sp.]|nr:hypothetical protein [Agathobacter sp.]